MDVLQVIKRDHDELRDLISGFASVTKVAERRDLFGKLKLALDIHTRLEEGYLYPEVDGLFPGSELFVDASTANHRTIDRMLAAIGKTLKQPVVAHTGLSREIDKLAAVMESHLRMEEEQMMPKLRVSVGTQDREDLGEVFQEMRDDWKSDPNLMVQIPKQRSKGKRKRA